MNHFNGFAISSQGFNHIKAGNKPCQDASGFVSDKDMSVIVVADGHGSDNYPRTDLGAKFAVDAAIHSIREYVQILNEKQIPFDVNDNEDAQLLEISKNILNHWHSNVDEDVKNNPFTETELEKVSEKYKIKYRSGEAELVAKAYGTTLIAVCITSTYWFGIHIGDGKCIAFDENINCLEPIPWDDNCQANITTSLCDSNAIDEFRFFKSNELPLSVFIGCDGIDDSYTNDKELQNLYRTILMIFAEYGCDKGIAEVESFLPSLSKKGSGDDVSIAGLVTSTITKEAIDLLKAQIEYENASSNLEKLSKECAIAREKVEYIESALRIIS